MPTKTDKELLERAAGLVGRSLQWSHDGDLCWLDREMPDSVNNDAPWNPLENDGDAFRLMIALEIDIDHWSSQIFAASCISEGSRQVCERLDPGVERSAATRRAIVRAAASVRRD